MSTEMTETPRAVRRIPFLDEAVRVPAYVRDLHGFREWAHSDDFPQRGRVSWLGGEIEVDMSPEEIESHNKAKTQLTAVLLRYVEAHDLGEVYNDGTLITNEDANLSTEPDVTFCTWETIESGRAQFTEWVENSERYIEIAGSPDLVVECVSNSSVRKDTVDLPARYFAAGVREYWIVDARQNHLSFRLLTRGDHEFNESPPTPDDFTPSPVLAAQVRLTRKRNRVGRWTYMLEIRP